MGEYKAEAEAVKAVAELGSDAIEAASKAGGFFTDILGDGPKDWLALKFSDRQKYQRAIAAVYDWENLMRVAHMVDGKLIRDGVTSRGVISAKLGIEFIENASLEDDEDILELYAELYANALNPEAKNSVEIKHLKTLKALSGRDLVELKNIYASVMWINPSGNSFELSHTYLKTEWVEKHPKSITELKGFIASGPKVIRAARHKGYRSTIAVQSLLNTGLIQRSLVNVNKDLNAYKKSLDQNLSHQGWRRPFGRPPQMMVRGSDTYGGLTSYGLIFCQLVMPKIVQLKP